MIIVSVICNLSSMFTKNADDILVLVDISCIWYQEILYLYYNVKKIP